MVDEASVERERERGEGRRTGLVPRGGRERGVYRGRIGGSGIEVRWYGGGGDGS